MKVNFIWLIQSIHRYLAIMIVLMIILHIFHMYIISSFKKPCELSGSNCTNYIFRCNRLFFILGPNMVLGNKNYNKRTEAISMIGSPLVELSRKNTSV